MCDNTSTRKTDFVKEIHRGLQRCLLISIMVIVSASCKKLIEIPSPTTFLTSENVYKNDNTAASVLTGIYTNMAASRLTLGATLNSISVDAGLSADELILYGGPANANTSLTQYYLNKLKPGGGNSSSESVWSTLYRDLYVVNLALERLQVSTSLTPVVRSQLIGEAKFLRALFYFYLTNLYKDVPLALSSDYRVNLTLFKSSQDSVYNLIISDLKEAKSLLHDRFVSSDAKSLTQERTRPSKWAASALLARAYLYKKDWSNAESEASEVIDESTLFGLDSLNGVFLKNSRESIWQLQPVNSGWNTEDARIFIIPASGPTSNSTSNGYPVFLSDRLWNSFESNDQRKIKWVNSITVFSSGGAAIYRYPYKYKSATLNAPVTEYETVLRLSEQYLIRTEARAQQSKISEALIDLNAIRSRAGLAPFTNTDKQIVLDGILHERQVELFTEWGHRWLDLKRIGNIDEVMPTVAGDKGTTWNPYWQWYPIPSFDIIQNPNLIQNDGY
jgi:hypothetical protein